jgi:hypothetical protein
MSILNSKMGQLLINLLEKLDAIKIQVVFT